MTMIDDVFGAEGLLAQKFPGYSPRKGQVDMARMVAAAIKANEHAIVEGPTGTGKSLAYLVPAIAHAAIPEDEQTKISSRVIVVTANIALQEQLVEKDLPLLRDVLGFPFRFALSKGKNNYVCVDSLGKSLVEHQTTKLRLPMVREDAIDKVLAWAQTTKTGDSSEFPDAIPPALWRKLSVQSDECKGSSCKWFERCFAEQASRKVRGAHVIVTNYHMFFAHLAVRAKMKEIAATGADVAVDIVLPPASVVIFDEAHKAADIARDFLGFQITKGSIDWLVRGFKHELGESTSAAAATFFAALESHKKSRDYRARLKKGHPLVARGIELADKLGRVAKFYKDSISASSWSPDESAELELRARRGYTLSQQVRDAMSLAGDGEIVYFIEELERGAILKSKPIDVAPFLKRELFESFPSVVVTSATLATGSNSFDYVKKELGVTGARELVAESPFAWKNQVLFVVPETMADPSDRDRFTGSVAEHVDAVCRRAKGRTLGLFTSFKNLEAAHRECMSNRFPYRLLKQGDAPRMKLVDQFKADTSSCLFGCESFWAGVDVPGESLSCVVIDRLPFPNPDDAIFDAISERDRNAFFTYAVPRAVIAFKQGFGRLIRTTTDRGVVVLLDQRIMTKGYGKSFTAAIPPVGFARDLGAIERFLDKERAA